MHEFERMKLEEEHATIRVALQMSKILAVATMSLIVFGCIAKHFGVAEKAEMHQVKNIRMNSKIKNSHMNLKMLKRRLKKKWLLETE